MKCITRNFTRGGEMIGRALIIPILYYNTKCQKFKIPVGGGGGGGGGGGISQGDISGSPLSV